MYNKLVFFHLEGDMANKMPWRVIPWQGGGFGLVRGNATIPIKVYMSQTLADLACDILNVVVMEIL